MMLLLIIFTVLLLHYIFFLKNILKGIKKVSEEKLTKSYNEFISVIIPFRNEEENLLRSVKSITEQSLDKTRYEVIYVDDNSDDNSLHVLEEVKKESNIKILKSSFSAEERAHKKKALNYAIENSNGEIIITTDADCTHGKDWLKIMTDMFDEQTGFVSGPVEFIENENLFSKLQKVEFSSLILVGAGLIGNKQL